MYGSVFSFRIDLIESIKYQIYKVRHLFSEIFAYEMTNSFLLTSLPYIQYQQQIKTYLFNR